MTIRVARSLDAVDEPLLLSPGRHKHPGDGVCAMEVVACIAGLPHTDFPRCTSEVIAAYIRNLNDNMPDHERSRLIPFLPRVIGINDEGKDPERNEVFAWQAIHLFLPEALRKVGHREDAVAFECETRLWAAQERADALLVELGPTGPNMLPIQWTLYRAAKAASTSQWFTRKRDDFFRGADGVTAYGACSDAAAGVAFHAWRVGCGDIWDLALFTLDEVIELA